MKDINGSPIVVDRTVEDLKKESEKNYKNREQAKACLLQTIIQDWNQASSIFFWRKCFKYVPLHIIRQVRSNIVALKKDGYSIRNEPGFFVKTLKDMGFYPFREKDCEQ